MGKARIKYEYQDDYEWIRVIDSFPENHRSLHFEDSIQGVIDLNNHHQPVLEYIALMAGSARLFQVLPNRVLIGGLGSAALLHTFNYWWRQQAEIITVEHSKRIHELARRFFRLRASDRIEQCDLRYYLGTSEDDFELIMVDCYSATSIPPHLTTREFMELLHDRLVVGGACVFNLWSPACNELCGDQLRTMMDVFGSVGVIACRKDQNFVAMVRKAPDQPWPESVPHGGQAYPIHRYSRSFPAGWPEYLRKTEVITDNNMASIFGAIGLVV